MTNKFKLKLPEGYWTNETEEGVDLWHSRSSHCLVFFSSSSEVFFFNAIYSKDAPAVIAFLQGAR